MVTSGLEKTRKLIELIPFTNVYWAKSLTDHPNICDNWFVVKYFETNFGPLHKNAFGISHVH